MLLGCEYEIFELYQRKRNVRWIDELKPVLYVVRRGDLAAEDIQTEFVAFKAAT